MIVIMIIMIIMMIMTIIMMTMMTMMIIYYDMIWCNIIMIMVIMIMVIMMMMTTMIMIRMMMLLLLLLLMMMMMMMITINWEMCFKNDIWSVICNLSWQQTSLFDYLSFIIIKHSGPVTPYDSIDMDIHSFRQWLVVYSTPRFYQNQLRFLVN